MARDPDWLDGLIHPRERDVVKAVARQWRLIMFAGFVAAVALAFIVGDRRSILVAAPVVFAVAAWALTRPRQFATTLGLLHPTTIAGELERYDPLDRVFIPPVRPLFAAPPPVEELRLVHVGYMLDDTGREVEHWSLRLWGVPILIGGMQGAGKSVLLWAILHGLAPWIRHGDVVVWGLDPKGGMELGYRPEMFTEFWCADDEDDDDYGVGAARLLKKACVEVRRRAGLNRGRTRKIIPSVEFPLLVIIIDEIASFQYAVADSKVRTAIDKSIRFITSQGRAVCVQVIGAIQDPRVETIGYRELFPQRIGLAMAADGQPDLLFGKGARDAGALCDLIPEDEPGVGYVKVRGRSYRKVKALWQDDDAIEALVRDYAPRRQGLAS